MCTTATLEVAGRKSPLFGMHTNYPDWSEVLKPGERAKLTVTFDPNYHGPRGLGRQKRQVGIYSNDSKRPLTIVTLLATVVDPLEPKPK